MPFVWRVYGACDLCLCLLVWSHSLAFCFFFLPFFFFAVFMCVVFQDICVIYFYLCPSACDFLSLSFWLPKRREVSFFATVGSLHLPVRTPPFAPWQMEQSEWKTWIGDCEPPLSSRGTLWAKGESVSCYSVQVNLRNLWVMLIARTYCLNAKPLGWLESCMLKPGTHSGWTCKCVGWEVMLWMKQRWFLSSFLCTFNWDHRRERRNTEVQKAAVQPSQEIDKCWGRMLGDKWQRRKETGSESQT